MGSRDNQERFYIIDSLRFSAALAVVFYHYVFRGWADDDFSPLVFPALSEVFKYGYLGVELFFIISGFVIYMSIQHATPSKFVIGRISRLYPAFWVCVTLTYLSIELAQLPQFQASFFQYLYNLSMVSGYLYLPHIDGVYWTLLIEIKFYFLMFCILLFKAKKHMLVILAVWLCIVFLHSTKLFILPNSIEFFLFPAYACYFISGVLFFLIHQKGVCITKMLLLSICFALGIHNAHFDMLQLATKYNSTFNIYVIASIIASFYLLFFAIATKKISIKQSSKITLMGALTYPLYLAHQNIGFIIFNLLDGTLNKYLILGLTTIFMLLVAYLVHKYVEAPFASWLKHQLNRLVNFASRSAASA